MKIRHLSFLFLFLACSGVALADDLPTPVVAPVTVSSEQLVTELTRQLTERFQIRGELKLELTRNWIAPTPAAGGYEVAIIDCPARLAPSFLLRIRLQSSNGVSGDLVLPVQAQLLRDVFAARTPIERETVFDPSQLDARRVDVLREHDVVAVDDCGGDLVYATSVQAGRLLIWRDLTKRALVRKGQIIEVSAVDGTMTITTKALAMENGAAGDAIKVRNLTSKKDFTAYVVAEAQAQVHF